MATAAQNEANQASRLLTEDERQEWQALISAHELRPPPPLSALC